MKVRSRHSAIHQLRMEGNHEKSEKILASILVFSMCLTLISQPAVAVYNSNSTEITVEENFITEREELSWQELFGQALEQLPEDEEHLIEMGLMEEDDRVNLNTRATGIVFGPYLTLNMPSAAAAVMIEGLAESGFVREVYNNTACYKFTHESNTTYVAVSAMMPGEDTSGQYPTNTHIASAVTRQLNEYDTNYYFSLKYDVEIVEDLYQHRFTLFSCRAGRDGTSHVFAATKVERAVTCIRNLSSVNSGVYYEHAVYPRIKMEIKDTSSDNIYMNSCVIQGEGSENTTTALQNLLMIGSSLVQIGSVEFDRLDVDTYYNLTSMILTLNPGANHFYRSGTAALSNPREGRYDYSCDMTSTFKLSGVSNYYQMLIGLSGSCDDCEYKVRIMI